MPGLVAAEGAALAVLAGLDGSPVWRVVRVLVLIAVTAMGVWVVPLAGHTQGLATAPRAWDAHVISFLHAALAPASHACGGAAELRTASRKG